jgi:hypothetical protein
VDVCVVIVCATLRSGGVVGVIFGRIIPAGGVGVVGQNKESLLVQSGDAKLQAKQNRNTSPDQKNDHFKRLFINMVSSVKLPYQSR